MGCPGKLDLLESLIKDHPLPHNKSCQYPMYPQDVSGFAEPPNDTTNKLMSGQLRTLAAALLGLIGWIVFNFRPDAYLAYIILSQFVRKNCTELVWAGILRLAHYLVSTKTLELTYRRMISPEASPEWAMTTDSALFSASHGGSIAGYAIGIHIGKNIDGQDIPNAPIIWRSYAQDAVVDSSGAAELTALATGYKALLGLRLNLIELNLLPDLPIPVFTDSEAIRLGAISGKITRAMKYLAARYQMVRQGVRDKIIALRSIPAPQNKSDALTKPTIGQDFKLKRSELLGIPISQIDERLKQLAAPPSTKQVHFTDSN